MFGRHKKIAWAEVEARAASLMVPELLRMLLEGREDLRRFALILDNGSNRTIHASECPRENALNNLAASHAAALIREAFSFQLLPTWSTRSQVSPGAI